MYIQIIRLSLPFREHNQGEEMLLAPSVDNQNCNYDTIINAGRA